VVWDTGIYQGSYQGEVDGRKGEKETMVCEL
jgi:hypothetical protein